MQYSLDFTLHTPYTPTKILSGEPLLGTLRIQRLDKLKGKLGAVVVRGCQQSAARVAM
jgi:hypothetical protein